MDDGGAARVVNWVRVSDLVGGGEATVFSSRLRVLSQDVLSRELVEAGFTVRRDQGTDRFSTAIAINEAVFGGRTARNDGVSRCSSCFDRGLSNG